MENIDNNKENVSFFINYEDNDFNKDLCDNSINISEELNIILNELEQKNISKAVNPLKLNEYAIKMVDYELNYRLKDLYLICEYYNILKAVKTNKCNKNEIINIILEFENDIANFDIVNKRKNMWFYINEIKNDKLLKKYLLL